MAIPPRSTEEHARRWEVADERPVRGRETRPDRAGLLLVGVVLVALIVALLVLFLL